MTESEMGFTLGIFVVFIASALWKAQGIVREWTGKINANAEALAETNKSFLHLIEKVRLLREIVQTGNGAGAADAALAQLATRLSQLEKAHAAQDLTILETAEKVAHKLQDRKRKRDQDEIGEVDDIPNDPNLMLARARAAFPIASPPTSNDPAQLKLLDERSA